MRNLLRHSEKHIKQILHDVFRPENQSETFLSLVSVTFRQSSDVREEQIKIFEPVEGLVEINTGCRTELIMATVLTQGIAENTDQR